MIRRLAPLLLAGGIGCSGLLVGIGADAWDLTALALLAEPALLVAMVWSALLLHWRGRTGLGLAVVAGVALALTGARLPFPTPWHLPDPKEGLSAVRRCATALDIPDAPVRLLHWRVGDAPPDAVTAVLTSAHPDVAVLFGASVEVETAAAGVVGGDRRRWESPGGALTVLASGGLHACGDSDAWSDGEDQPGTSALAFVGAGPETIFPLVVTRLPGPFRPDAAGSRTRVAALVAAIGGRGTVVVADALAPSTFRVLDRGLLDLGLVAIPSPPGWPWHVPLIPALHPDMRVWTGPVWHLDEAGEVDAPTGDGPAVLTVLHGPRREAG